MKTGRFSKQEDDTLIKMHWHFGRHYVDYIQDYLPERSKSSVMSRMHILRKRYHWER